MILAASCFSCGDQRDKFGINASTSDQFSKACRSVIFQRDESICSARLTSATAPRRMRWLSPANFRAMRRFISKPRLRVENESQGPDVSSAAKADVECAAFAARLEVVPFPER